MGLIKCSQCGKQISDKVNQCPHFGTDTKAEPIGNLTFEWRGKWMAVDTMVYLSLNGVSVGDSKSYSFKNGFNVTAPILAGESQIRINAGSLIDDTFSCHFKKGKNYICKLFYNHFMGGFTYQVSEEGGNIIFNKGYSTARKILCVIGIVILILSAIYLVSLGKDKLDNTADTSNYVNKDSTAAGATVKEESKPSGLSFGNTYSFTLVNRGFTSDYFQGTYSSVVCPYLKKLTGVNLTITFRYFKDGTSKFDISQKVLSNEWEQDVEHIGISIPRNFTATQTGNGISESDLKFNAFSRYDEQNEAIVVKIPRFNDGHTPLTYYEDADFQHITDRYEGLAVDGPFKEIDSLGSGNEFYIDKDFNVFFNSYDLQEHKNSIGKLKQL